MRTLILAIALLSSSCATVNRLDPVPVSLQGAGASIFRADEAVVLLTTIADAAQRLNEITNCDPSGCHQLLSPRNTGIVLQVIKGTNTALDAVPSGWASLVQAALDQISRELDAEGRDKLRPYLVAAQVAIGSYLQNRK